MADIVGRRLGAGNKLPFNEDKSAAGSLAFFIVGFGMSVGFVALFHHLGYMEMDGAGRWVGRARLWTDPTCSRQICGHRISER